MAVINVVHNQYAGRLVQFGSDENPVGKTIDLVAVEGQKVIDCEAIIRVATMNPYLPRSPIVLELEVEKLDGISDNWVVKIKNDHDWAKNYRLIRRGRWVIIYLMHEFFQPNEPVIYSSSEVFAADVGKQLQIEPLKFTRNYCGHNELRVISGLGSGMICVKSHAGVQWSQRTNNLGMSREKAASTIKKIRLGMLFAVGIRTNKS